jgi:hypothetical protein
MIELRPGVHCSNSLTFRMFGLEDINTNIMFLDIVDNVQKRNICLNVPSSQTFRSYLEY